MNSVLSTIAAIVVVLLIAALVGPTFVDWNHFRNEIEAQGKRLTGRDLKIGGDISFVMLPAPHLTLNDVSIDNLKGAENSDFARIGQIDGEVALAPLLSGKISVTSVTVTRPQIHLEVMEDGRANWHGLVSGPVQEDGLFGLSSVSLEKARFEDGTITYSDHRSGRSWRVDHVGGDVIATSLVGPMRADLAFDASDVPLSLRLAIGNFSAHRAFPITAELQSRAAPAKLLFSGVSTGFSSNARIDGTGSLEVGTTRTEDGQTPRAPLRVESDIVTTGDAASFRNLVVAMAGTTLKGSAEADWSDRPKASVHLGGEALTVDPAIGQMKPFLSGGKVPLGSLVNIALPHSFDVDADMKVSGLLVGDVLVKDAAVVASLKNGELDIRKATGTIGGGTNISLDGKLADAEEGGRFEGRLGATSDNLAALAAWISTLNAPPGEKGPDKVAVPQALVKEPRRSFAVSTAVVLTPERLELNGLKAAYAASADAADLSGSLALAERDGRPVLNGTLAAKTFDLDPLAALWPAAAPKPLDLLKDNDLDLTLSANRLTLGGEDVSGLDASVALTKGELDVRRFSVADLAGARLSLSGTVGGATAASISALQGNVHGTVDAQNAEGILKLAGLDRAGLGGPLQLTLDANSGQAVDSQARLDTLALKGTADGSRVDAVLKRGHASDGEVDRVDLAANIANDDGRKLLRQLGYDAGDTLTGAGTASLQLSGAVDKPYDTTLRINVGAGTLNAKGALTDPLGAASFAGHVDMSAGSVAPVLAALGTPPGVAEFAAAQAAGPSFVFSSDAKVDGETVALSSLETVAGNLHVSGEVTYSAAEDGKLPTLTARLETNALDLTPLFAAGKGGDAIWPTAALDWSVLGRFDGEADLKAKTIKLGTLHLDQSVMHLALTNGVLSATPFTAKFADGDATIGARIEGGKTGEPGIGLTLAVDGADLALIGPEAFGASFGTGRTDMKADLEAQGRSWLALISSISGSGSFKSWSTGLVPLDLPAFSAGITKLKSLDDFAALEAETLEKGNTPVDGLEGDFTVKDAVVHFDKDALALKGGKAKLTSMFDFGRLAADAELDVKLDEPKDAPGFSIAAAGKVGAIERRVDTAALQNFASTQLLKATAEESGLNFIPKELKQLIGLSDDEKAKGPEVAGIPLPMKRPEPTAALQ